MSSDSAISQFIEQALEKLPADKMVEFNSDRSFAKMQCPNPNHKGGREGTASLRINVKKSGKFWAGSGKCWSCGFRVKNWNELADWISGAKLEDGFTEDEFVAATIFDDKYKAMFDDDQEVELEDIMPWEVGQDWRTIKGKLMRSIKAGIIFDKKTERMYVYLPVKVNGKLVGYVKANIVKYGKNNYFNSPGIWTNEYGLFPYDYVAKMIKRRKLTRLVLVEGPRDALNCIQKGIPALACLGASNWSEMKTELVLAMQEYGVNTIITAFDPDEAGDNLTKAVYNSMKREIKVKRFAFPTKEEVGKKIDPGNMPKSIARKLKTICYAEQRLEAA